LDMYLTINANAFMQPRNLDVCAPTSVTVHDSL
jgi:hypothetical protein